MPKGYVYILSNPAMPGVVKIGRTTGDPRVRASQLRTTGVPLDFVVESAVLSPDCEALETAMHELFAEDRVSADREFFSVSVNDAVGNLAYESFSILDQMLSEYVGSAFVSMIDVMRLSSEAKISPEAVSRLLCSMSGDELKALADGRDGAPVTLRLVQ